MSRLATAASPGGVRRWFPDAAGSAAWSIRSRWLFDGDCAFLQDAVVAGSGDVIEGVFPADEYDGPVQWDLGDCTVVPGLIDGHAHILWDRTARARSDKGAALATYGLAVLQEALDAGVTTVVDAGSPGRSGFVLKEALERRLWLAPRLLVSGPAITTTAGHAREIGMCADDTPAIRRAVRTLVEQGADLIKLMGSGGLTDDRTSNRRRAQYTEEEMRAAVEEAHRLRRPVVVHANATEAVLRAAAAGTDVIAHANFLGPEEDSVLYAPVAEELLAHQGVALDLNIGPLADDLAARDGQVRDWPDGPPPRHRWDLLARIRDRGVPAYLTSDTIGRYARPFPVLLAGFARTVGLGGTELIRRATSWPARGLAMAGVGRVAVGFCADLVAFPGDLRRGLDPNPVWVMRGGAVVRHG